MVLYSFVCFVLLFTIVGLLSSLKKTNNVKDYVMASNDTSPWLLGLSTFATNNSGFMFTAIIGYAYTVGLSAIWITFPWILGDLLASYMFMNKIYKLSSQNNALTYLDILTKNNNTNYRYLRIIGGIIIIIFLGVHSSAQFKATSYAFHSLVNWDIKSGAILTSFIVLVYCFSGGIRASIWTDLVQSILMFISMLILCVVAIDYIGGFSVFWSKINKVSIDYMSFFPKDIKFGAFWGGLFVILGYIVGGAGIVGQPHLVIRYMSMRNSKDINKLRLAYYGGYTLFAILVFCVAFCTKILMPNVLDGAKEFLLFDLANSLLPSVLVGIVLAGLFSASVSTIDSQVLSCSSTIINDLGFGKKGNIYLYNKLGTLFVVLTALGMSLYNSNSIFDIVFSAWSVLSCAFAPLIILQALNKQISEKFSFIIMIISLCVMYIWYALGWANILYEVAPGVFFGLLSYVVLNKFNLKILK